MDLRVRWSETWPCRCHP